MYEYTYMKYSQRIYVVGDSNLHNDLIKYLRMLPGNVKQK